MLWYSMQELCIRCRAEMSSYCTVSNGVKQGGIITPLLFGMECVGFSSQELDVFTYRWSQIKTG